MVTFLTVIHYVVCIFLIVIVLLQHGKGADIGATFGGASQTVFGSRGAATFLHKLTVGAAVTLFVTSLSLAYLSARRSDKSIFAGDEQKKEQPAAAAGTTEGVSDEAKGTEAKPADATADPKSDAKPGNIKSKTIKVKPAPAKAPEAKEAVPAKAPDASEAPPK